MTSPNLNYVLIAGVMLSLVSIVLYSGPTNNDTILKLFCGVSAIILYCILYGLEKNNYRLYELKFQIYSTNIGYYDNII